MRATRVAEFPRGGDVCSSLQVSPSSSQFFHLVRLSLKKGGMFAV